ncbi:MAG: ATP-binding cassette domain-containing protein [Clostridia bacterium]|nr:ATP-binding cassette domain-containing protein [Clostridia bacterium]
MGAKKEQCALKLEKIVKVYGSNENQVHALKGVDINFRKNEFVSILGPSGCGKTTLLNIIGGLDRYTSGDLIINGVSTKEYKDADWDRYRNNSIGFVFQSYNLIPHQTVLSNVELALTLSGIDKKERQQRAMKMLEKVGLSGQENKLPNQLSGGQMQRVAIARALINDPEIILADEPTGALDTETSVQVLDLLKEVAKDRLVIMVTHNPDLAKKYSTRIINLLDGEKISDTNPLNVTETESAKKQRKPKMSFFTALKLSLKNLISKKTRTILTSFAGSIGIIGVAMVLALSNGFNAYMARMQTDSLATYPLTISENSVDLSSFSKMVYTDAKEQYPQLDNVFVEEAFSKLKGMLKSNNLSNDNGFLDYLHEIDKNYYHDIEYDYGYDMTKYLYADFDVTVDDKPITESNFTSIDDVMSSIQLKYDGVLQQAMGMSGAFVRQFIPTVQQIPNSKELIEEQYDVLYGKMPSLEENNFNEAVLVVDKYNGVSDMTLAFLGLISADIKSDGTVIFGDGTTESVDIKNIVTTDENEGKKLYLANNNLIYQNGMTPATLTGEEEGLEEIKIVGILRAKPNVEGILKTGLCYTKALGEKVVDDNKGSDIVKLVEENYLLLGIKEEQKNTVLRQLAGIDTPSEIKIYAKDFDSKEIIKKAIDDWNITEAEGKEENENYITYADTMSMMFSMLSTMVDAVTYVLVAFTSISLVVSSVMIGIITYISVVERTKEIGVLRALGASKREVSNVFNAETFLIGLFAGVIGVTFTYLVSIPINLLLGSLVEGVGSLAVLSPIVAVVLIVISVALTLIAGLIPARVASKKDPVVALRTE